MENISAEVVYNSLLQNKDIYIHLQHLVNEADKFLNKESDYDIIKEYLHMSINCQELLDIIKELSTSDIRNAMLLLNALSYILIRIARDLDIYITAGKSIVNGILSHGMNIVFNFLKFDKTASRTKLALHLITSMIALGNQTALQVVSKLNFSDPLYMRLLIRRNRSEDEDVRSAFLNLIVLIITVCNDNIIKQLTEIKGFFNEILSGMTSDRVSTIILVLNTFRQYIIENRIISKTTKMQLFNHHSLKSVIQLCYGKGPIKIGKRKFEDVNDEETAEVHSCAHEFLLTLCSHKKGIKFSDPTCGMSGRNNNMTITNILKSLPKPYSDPSMCDFVISILQACPDQLKFYLPIYKQSIIPRLSLSWLNTINFLKKIIKTQNPVLMLFKTEIKRPVPDLVNIAKIFCLLDLVSPTDISEVFLNGHRILCYHMCSFLLSIFTQVKIILDYCDHPESSNFLYDSSEVSAFKISFLSVMFLCLPAVDTILCYWNKVTIEGSVIMEDETLKDLPIPTLFEELLPLIEVIKLYKTLSCKLNRQCDLDLPVMLNNLKTCSTVLSYSDLSEVYVSLTDVLFDQYAVNIWSKQKITDSPLTLFREVYLAAHRSRELAGARNILRKILKKTKIFDNCLWEIDLWLDALEYAKSKHIPEIFEFINEAIHFVLKQSNNFIFDETGNYNNTKKNEDSRENETASEDSSSKKKTFSDFVLAVLHNLLLLEESKRKNCQMFVEKALDHVMHYQHSAKNFFTAVEQYKPVINPAIYDYWKFLSFSSSKIKICIGKICTGITPCNLDLIDHLRQNFISCHSSTVEVSLCDIKNYIGCLGRNSVRKVIWQLLMYADFEAKLIFENELQNSMMMFYFQLLETILNSLPLFKNELNYNLNGAGVKIENCNTLTEELAIDSVKDFLKHPITLKFFLFDINTVENNVDCIRNNTIAITKLVLHIVKKILNLGKESLYSYLFPFKKKVFKFLKKSKMNTFEDVELSFIVETFALLLNISDIQILLQTLLNVENETDQNFVSYIPSMCLLIRIFLEKKEFALLSPSCINSLISTYVSLPKKRKNILQEYISQLMLQHPIYTLLLTRDSIMLLLQHSSVKDLNILGVLIDYSNKFQQITQTYISETLDVLSPVKFLYLASKCLCNTKAENKHEAGFKDLISSRFFDSFKEFMLNDLTNDADILHKCAVGKAMQVLLQDKKEYSTELLEFCELLMKNHSNQAPSASKMNTILQLFYSLKYCSLDTDNIRLPILKVCFSGFSAELSGDFINFELTNFIREIIENLDCLELDSIIDVTDFFQKSIKFALKSDDIGKDILKILYLLCEKSKGNNLPVISIHGLLLGHSRFFEIMLTEETEKNTLKEHLIDLLTILTKLNGSVCKENHIGLLLSAYGASMNNIDQKLLYLLKLYADNNVNMDQYSPFLWGKSAISYYAIVKASQSYLWKQPKFEDVLSLFELEKIERTLLHFPLTMKLEPCSELFEMENHLTSKIYDMRFILPLFVHLLSPDTLVPHIKFIESKVLMLIFISLSSFEESVRALGLYCLAEFYQHLEGAYFNERFIWLHLLDSLRNSIGSSNPKIPNIVSLFLARTADIFTQPDHKLYCCLSSFITSKPLLDIGQVPEFYILFNSTHADYQISRQWLLNLLADGLRSTLDFHICEKRYVFSTLLVHYVSCLSTNQEKVAILQTLNSAVKIKSSAKTLYQRSLLTWVSNVVEDSDSSEIEVLKNLCIVMESLEANIPDHFYFTTVLWKLIPKVRFLDISAVKTLISTLLRSLNIMKNSDYFWSKYRISGENIDQLYELWKYVNKHLEAGENELMEGHISLKVSEIKECLLIFAKISTLWEPLLEEIPEILYNKQLNSLCNILELILKINSYSLFHFNDLPIWLHKCVKSDTKHGFVKVLLSSEGFKSLTSIIGLFEKSLSQKDEYKKMQHIKWNCNSWKEFFFCLKEISTNSNIISESPMFQQICTAI
ncbi:nucleolar pre-ribosomal-associated protein 1 [Nephila pilipes]|uniref:Nucleolar pre-ribosomal-associated protein 1 n=1 Tax=Nephila pilipes TaxID=299642 RepID=A0A8X6QCK7_NEPPI|nr:nucleolar pre-ribosomal-associated protein 1 [Nephila pilipes]